MEDQLFVSTGADGIEHTASGPVQWLLPGEHGGAVTEHAGGLVLRRPVALLEVLDEAVFTAEALDGGPPRSDGTVTARRARLLAATPWGTESAARFALDCAEHAEHDLDGVQLPDGTPLRSVVRDARDVLDGADPGALAPLGYLARLRAERRLRHEREQLAELQGAVIVDDERHGRDALDDTDYDDLLPITDAVLAAIAALGHHLAPRLLAEAEESFDSHDEHTHDERSTPSAPSRVYMTPWGPVARGPHVTSGEAAWTAAREAARHARLAAATGGAPRGEASERAWQAGRLEELLNS